MKNQSQSTNGSLNEIHIKECNRTSNLIYKEIQDQSEMRERESEETSKEAPNEFLLILRRLTSQNQTKK